MDESHLFSAMRYVENNPVKADLVKKAEDYPWSSAAAHVKGSADHLLSPCYLIEEIRDWSGYLRSVQTNFNYEKDAGKHLSNGRPMGSAVFIEKLENITSRTLKLRAAGRPMVHENFVKK